MADAADACAGTCRRASADRVCRWRRVWIWFRRGIERYRHRQAFQRLEAMSDRMLDDIGLTRADLDRIRRVPPRMQAGLDTPGRPPRQGDPDGPRRRLLADIGIARDKAD